MVTKTVGREKEEKIQFLIHNEVLKQSQQK